MGALQAPPQVCLHTVFHGGILARQHPAGCDGLAVGCVAAVVLTLKNYFCFFSAISCTIMKGRVVEMECLLEGVYCSACAL